MNSIGGDTLEMLKIALNEVEKNFVGLVVGNQGKSFSVGASLMLMLMEAQDENGEELEMIGRLFQSSVMSLRYSPKPVVVAPFQMVFGGGCEMVLHADRVRASAETYIGLVEVGVGIIPAGCGPKEMRGARCESIPEAEGLVGEKVGGILTGGDLNHETRVSEQYLLDLEREAFLSLIGTRPTQDRIAHMLKTGKPLRN